MEQINNILVTLSFDAKEQAEINHTLALAKLYSSKISLLSVVPELTSADQLKISAMSPEERQEKEVKDRKDGLAKISESISDAGFSPSTYVTIGKPEDEIVKHAIDNDHDLVIIGTRPQKTITEKLFGSTSTAVVRRCPTPVLAVKPDHSGNYCRIVACVDISQDPEIINKKVISEAIALAKADGGELHLVTVIPKSMPDSNSPTDDAKQTMQKLLDDEDVGDVKTTLHIGSGDAISVIPKKVEKYTADLLVMGMASRQGIMGFIVGNLAEKVMSSVDCSVLIVKPDGFKP